jgi:hypothetical protein
VIFLPIFGIDCSRCDNQPIVGLVEDDGERVQSLGLCGVCYFHDRLMVDYDLWNEAPEGTE